MENIKCINCKNCDVENLKCHWNKEDYNMTDDIAEDELDIEISCCFFIEKN